MEGAEPHRRRPRLGRAEQQAETRRILLHAAAETFGERGFHGSSIEEISARAGVTRGAFYSNFTSKEDAFLALMDQRMSARVDSIRALLATVPPGSLFADLRAWSERVHDPRWLPLALEFRLHALRNEHVRQALAKRQRAERDAYGDAITQQFARASVELPVPAADLALILQALDYGIPVERALDPEEVRTGFFYEAAALLYDATVALSNSRPRQTD